MIIIQYLKMIISLYHVCKKYRMPIESLETIINLRGHSHFLSRKGYVSMCVPTLSDDLFDFDKDKTHPGFLIGELKDGSMSIDSYCFYKDSVHHEGKILTKKLK